MKKLTPAAWNTDNDQEDGDLGEFNQEETPEGLTAVQASKPSMVKVQEGQKGIEPVSHLFFLLFKTLI